MKLKQKYLFRLFFNKLHFHISHKDIVLFSVRNGYVKRILLFNYYFYFRKPLKV